MKNVIVILALWLSACCTSTQTPKQEVITKILTKDSLMLLSTDQILQDLSEGNQNFAQNSPRPRNLAVQLGASLSGQAPRAIILSCIDSRVPVEAIFDQGLGDIFVTRTAGNIVNEDILGGLEYACAVVGSKVIVVLGHTSCGAVSAACKGFKAGNMTTMLEKIHPAIDSLKAKGCDHKNVDLVAEENVKLTIERIRNESPMIKELEKKGVIKIVGAIFDLKTGKVNMLE